MSAVKIKLVHVANVVQFSHWIQIGAHDHHGGHPVLIDDEGNIHTGPLAGRNIHTLHKSSRTSGGREKDAARRKPPKKKKKAKR